MKNAVLILSLIFILSACSSTKEKFYDDYSATCIQNRDAVDLTLHDCARFDNERDLYKWHRVKPWQELGEMPDMAN